MKRCQVLGDGLQPHLKGLSASQVLIHTHVCSTAGIELTVMQVKLVSVYIARALPDATPAIGDS